MAVIFVIILKQLLNCYICVILTFSTFPEIRKLASALARQTGQEEKEARSHLFQRLSILLVRGNCALFVNRIPENISADIDGQE